MNSFDNWVAVTLRAFRLSYRLLPEIEISYTLHENRFSWRCGPENQVPPKHCYTITTIRILAMVVEMEAMQARENFD